MRLGTPCFCGSDDFEVLLAHSKAYLFDGKRAIVKCRKCGVLTRSPSLFCDPSVRDDLPAALNVVGRYAGDGGAAKDGFRRRLQRAAQLIGGRKVLDIGAGTGTFLAEAKALGWDPSGTELDEHWRSVIMAAGFECLDVDICSHRVSNERRDLVHANHVFEHMRDPLAALRNLREVLNPNGVVVIEVPYEFGRLKSVIRRLAGRGISSRTGFLEHEWFYSPGTLRSLLKQAGFDVLSLSTPRLAGISPARGAYLALEALFNRGPVIEAWARIRQRP